MQAVRRYDTEPEMRLRPVLWNAGLRYRLDRRVGGTRPDLCFVAARVVVFVDGCFWHGCPDHYAPPVHNSAFWKERLEKNHARDRRDNRRLERVGWSVLRYWECEVQDDATRIVQDVRRHLTTPHIS
ncbi:MAG: very short patch repair endonuclease [Gammaproteobacteria bacterium]|nr:very short patch repair endonuclease [Gammaproteobacteria bacterium]